MNIPDLKISTKYLIAILVLVKILGVVFATEVFARFTPLVDSKLYLDGYYTADQFFRTRVIQWLATAVNSWGGGDYLAHLTFAMISALGLAYYYLTGGRRWIWILTLLLPSSLGWSAIVGKEAMFFGGMGLGLVIWSKYTVSSLNWVDIIIAALAIGVCAALRPHYLVALLWLFLATALFKRLENKAWVSLLLLFVAGALSVYFTGLWMELLEHGWGGIDPSARASRYQSLELLFQTQVGFDRYNSLIPLGLILGIIGPMPYEVLNRVEFLPFFLEGVLILLAPFLIFLLAIKRGLHRDTIFLRMFFGCLLPAILILLVLHAPFGLLNPGSAIRW